MAADAALDILKHFLASAKDPSAEGIDKVISQAIADVHERLLAAKCTSGAALVICCINTMREEISVWNLGDTMALLISDSDHVMLSTDHRVERNHMEIERITRCDGTLARERLADGTFRGPLRAFPGGLTIARSIGDAECASIVAPTRSHCRLRSALDFASVLSSGPSY